MSQWGPRGAERAKAWNRVPLSRRHRRVKHAQLTQSSSGMMQSITKAECLSLWGTYACILLFCEAAERVRSFRSNSDGHASQSISAARLSPES